MGRIIHGNKNFGYAPIVSSEGTFSFGTPVMLDGMVSSTIEVEQSDNKIYADDTTYCVVKGAKVRTAEVGLRYIDEAYAQYLGYYLNEDGTGYPISEIMQATAFIIADASELNGKRTRGSYIGIIERHLETTPNLSITMRKPDLLTPLILLGNGRGALIGAVNPNV